MSKMEIQNFSKYGIIAVEKQIKLFFPNIEIKISKLDDNKFFYHRKDSENNTEEKTVTTKTNTLKIHLAPIAALQKPSHETKFMFLRFKNKITLEKDSEAIFSVPCPIEIGIFRSTNSGSSLLDSFSCHPLHSRFAVYGPADTGILCKYARVLPDVASPEPYVFAEMKVSIKNETQKDVSLSKIVFPVANLGFYYKENAANADSLNILLKKATGDHQVAEIVPSEYKTESVWEKSPDTFTKESSPFIMEWGFE